MQAEKNEDGCRAKRWEGYLGDCEESDDTALTLSGVCEAVKMIRLNFLKLQKFTFRLELSAKFFNL